MIILDPDHELSLVVQKTSIYNARPLRPEINCVMVAAMALDILVDLEVKRYESNCCCRSL